MKSDATQIPLENQGKCSNRFKGYTHRTTLIEETYMNLNNAYNDSFGKTM